MLDLVTMHPTYANLMRVMVRPSMSRLSTRLMACLLFHLVNWRLLFYDYFICLFIITGPGAITYTQHSFTTRFMCLFSLCKLHNHLPVRESRLSGIGVEENGRRQAFERQILSAKRRWSTCHALSIPLIAFKTLLFANVATV